MPAPRKISSISLGNPNRTGFATTYQSENIHNSLTKEPEIKDRFGATREMTLTFKSGTAVTLEETTALQRRKIVRLTYDDGSIEEYRIESTSRDPSGESDTVVKCYHIKSDLADNRVRKTLTSGHVILNVPFYSMTVTEILNEVLGSDYNCPSHLVLGTIDGSIATDTISVLSNNNTHLDIINAICKEVGGEWDVSYNSTNDNWEVNIEVAGELGGGIAQSSTRLIEMGNGIGNRIKLKRSSQKGDFFSRAVPLGGQGNETFGIQDAIFPVNTVLVNEALSHTDISLKHNAIHKNGFLVGQFFGDPAVGIYEITASTAPNLITVSGVATSLTSGRFCETLTGDKLSYIEDKTAVTQIGEREIDYRRTDITPYDNLLEDFSVSPDFSEFSSGVATGWQAWNGAVLSEETAATNISFGNRAQRVTADEGEGIQSIAIDLSPTGDNPYFSLWVAGKVISGSYKIELVDSAGTAHPVQQRAETNSTLTRAIEISGIEPSSGNARIRITALEDGSVFILDACTLTQSTVAYPFNSKMGARSLFIEAGLYVRDQAGLSSDLYEVELYDYVFEDDVNYREITAGSFVDIKDSYDPDTDSYAIEFTGRVYEVSYQEGEIYGRRKKRIKVAKLGERLSSFFTDSFVSKSSLQNSPSITQVRRDPNVIEYDETQLDAQALLDQIKTVDGYNSGLVAQDSRYWEGRAFGNFMNQPVRTGDTVTFDRTISNSMMVGTTSFVGSEIARVNGRMRIDGELDMFSTSPTMNIGGAAANQVESGRLRFKERSAFYQGAFIHYDGSANRLNFGTHEANDELASSDIVSFYLSRTTGNVSFEKTVTFNGRVEMGQTLDMNNFDIEGANFIKFADFGEGLWYDSNTQFKATSSGFWQVDGDVNGTIRFEIENRNAGASAETELFLNQAGNNFSLRVFSDASSSPNETWFESTAGSSKFSFRPQAKQILTLEPGLAKFYSSETSKEGYRITVNSLDAETLQIYGYDETSTTFKPIKIGGTSSANSGLTIQEDGDVILGTFSNDIYFGSNGVNTFSYNLWKASASGGMGIQNTATASTGHIYFTTSQGEKMRIAREGNVTINSNQNVGILINNTSNTGGQIQFKNTLGDYVVGITGATSGDFLLYDVANTSTILTANNTSLNIEKNTTINAWLKVDDDVSIGSSETEVDFIDRYLSIANTNTNRQAGLLLKGNVTSDTVISAIFFQNEASSHSEKRVSQISSLRDGDNDASLLRFAVWDSTATPQVILDINNLGATVKRGSGDALLNIDAESGSTSDDAIIRWRYGGADKFGLLTDRVNNRLRMYDYINSADIAYFTSNLIDFRSDTSIAGHLDVLENTSSNSIYKLRVGRNNFEFFGIAHDDGGAYLRSVQDETGSEAHYMIYSVDSSASGDHFHRFDINSQTKLTIKNSEILVGSSMRFGSADNLNMNIGSYITFFGESSAFHAIGSRGANGLASDDIRLNTFGSFYINLDSNSNNSSAANFQIYRHGGTATLSDLVFQVDGENKNVTSYGRFITSGGGSSASPAYTSNLDLDTGMYFPSAGKTAITSDGVIKLQVDTNQIDIYRHLKHNAEVTKTVSAPTSAGWYKLADNIDGARRGTSTFILSTTGGSWTPCTFVINVFSDWSGNTRMKLERYGNVAWITDARVIEEDATNNLHLEVYLVSDADGSSFQAFQTSLLGYSSNWQLDRSGTFAPSAFTTGYTVRRQMSFATQGGGTSFESIVVNNNSTFQSQVTINNALITSHDQAETIRTNATGTSQNQINQRISGVARWGMIARNNDWYLYDWTGAQSIITAYRGSDVRVTFGTNEYLRANINKTRFEVWDSTDERIAMGFLDNLPKNDGSGNWDSNHYGFWVKAGDTLTIDGDVNYEDGDWLIEGNATIKIQDGINGYNIINLGTVNGDKGLFWFDGSASENVIAKVTDSEAVIATWSLDTNRFYNSTNNIQIGNNLTQADGWINIGQLTNGTRKISSSGSSGNLAEVALDASDRAWLRSYKDSANEFVAGEDYRNVNSAGLGNFTVRLRVGGQDIIHVRNSSVYISGWDFRFGSFASVGVGGAGDNQYSNSGISLGSTGYISAPNFYLGTSTSGIAGWSFTDKAISETGTNNAFVASDATAISSTNHAARPVLSFYNTTHHYMVNVGNIYKNSSNDGIALFSDWTTNEKYLEFSQNLSTGVITAQIAGWSFNTKRFFNSAEKVYLGDNADLSAEARAAYSGTLPIGSDYKGFRVYGSNSSNFIGITTRKDTDQMYFLAHFGSADNRVAVGDLSAVGQAGQGIVIRQGGLNWFRVSNSTGEIAGWNFTSQRLYSGNIELNTIGRIRHTSDRWRFNDDGSWILSNGRIQGDSAGSVFLRQDVNFLWGDGSNLVGDPTFRYKVEDNLYWNASTGISFSSTAGENSTYAAVFSANGNILDMNANLGADHRVYAKGSRTLFVSARVFISNDLNGQFQLAVTTYDQSDNIINFASESFTNSSGDAINGASKGSWITVKGTITLPNNCSWFRPRPSLRNNATTGSVTMSEVYYGWVEDGANTNPDYITSTAITATEIQSPTITGNAGRIGSAYFGDNLQAVDGNNRLLIGEWSSGRPIIRARGDSVSHYVQLDPTDNEMFRIQAGGSSVFQATKSGVVTITDWTIIPDAIYRSYGSYRLILGNTDNVPGGWASSWNGFSAGSSGSNRIWLGVNDGGTGYEFSVYSSSNYIVRLGNSTNVIAGWNLTSTRFYNGNIELNTSGYIRHTSDLWRLNNDGSGILANGNISWNTNGRITIKRRGENLMERSHKLDWEVGDEAVSIDGFAYNGGNADQLFEVDEDPFGSRSVIWKGVGTSNSSDGGWNGSYFPSDHTKTYRFVVFMRKKGSTDASSYLGTNGGGSAVIRLSNGATEGNPYFFSGELPSLDQWYLVVGYVRSSDTPNGSAALGAIYNVSTGKKVSTLADFKSNIGTTSLRHRAYHFYNSTAGTETWFFAPMVHVIDGSEPSISDILGFNSTTLDAYMVSSPTIIGGTDGANYVKLSSTGFQAFNGGTERARINVDGSGWFGSSSAFYWTTGGTVNAGGWTVSSSSLSKNNTIISSSGYISLGSGTNGYNQANRIWIDGANTRMSIGTGFRYSGDQLTIDGKAVIGGFTIGATKLGDTPAAGSGDAGGNSNDVVMEADTGFHHTKVENYTSSPSFGYDFSKVLVEAGKVSVSAFRVDALVQISERTIGLDTDTTAHLFGVYDDSGIGTNVVKKIERVFGGWKVEGTLEVASTLSIPDRIDHVGDTNTYMQFHAADQWRVVTGGSERLEVNNNEVRVANNLAILGSYLMFNVAGGNTDVSISGSDSNLGSTGANFTFWGDGTAGNARLIAEEYQGSDSDSYYRIHQNHDWFINGTNRMRLETDGDLHVDGDVIGGSTTVSDIRLKSIYGVIESPIEKIKRLRGVRFVYNNLSRKSGENAIGYIADEVKEVLPDAVKERVLPLLAKDDREYKTVTDAALIALLIEGVKEMADRLDELEKNN